MCENIPPTGAAHEKSFWDFIIKERLQHLIRVNIFYSFKLNHIYSIKATSRYIIILNCLVVDNIKTHASCKENPQFKIKFKIFVYSW
jgi:hypothetical protein